MVAKKHAVDFSNVKEGSGINPVRVEEGDYLAKIISVEDHESKAGNPTWVFVFQLDDRKSATYPYYCGLVDNQLWKIRNLLVAAGKTVPKKRVNVDPNSIVGKEVGITLSDDEYEGKEKSVIDAIFPASELADDEPPAKKTSSKKASAKDDDVEDIEEEVEDDDEDLDLDDL